MRQVRAGASWSGSERNRVFLHRQRVKESGWPRYQDVSALTGLDFLDDARGLAITDWDQDGDLDVWFRNRTAPRLRLMANQSTHKKPDFLAIRLQGTKSNKNALGARVRVNLINEERPLIQTLRAGGGFLSQSSKWLHFGLGADSIIEEISVRWPNGIKESFSEIQAGSRVTIVEGSGKAVAFTPTPRILRPSKPITNRSLNAPIILPRKVLLPDFTLLPETSGPTWIIVWSPDCPHCQEELREIVGQSALIKESDLEVCALALQSEQASVFLEEISFPFPSRFVDDAVLDRLHHWQSALFDQSPPAVVPLSVLVDRNQNAVAIARGEITPGIMLAHAPLVKATDRELRDRAAPYTGQWYTKPQTSHVLLEYMAEKMHSVSPQSSAFYYERAGKKQIAARIHYDLAMAGGRPTDSEKAFRKAISLNPLFDKAHNNLGALLANQERFEEAAACFREALKLDPSNEKARMNLNLLEQVR